MGIPLYPHQKKAVSELSNGKILCGGVGSGKSRTSLAYYHIQCGGELEPYKPRKDHKPLYIITTARKRDSNEWEEELLPFLFDDELDIVEIDSWNNIKKYIDVTDSFFIFDEQRVVGSGAWVKAFLKITKANSWILLSATPGDTWMDYVPVFIANGFYKNKTEFIREHVVYNYRLNFPQIDRYLNTGRLLRLRNSLLVNMTFERKTVQNHIDVFVDYNIPEYKKLFKERWDYEKDEPIQNASELCYKAKEIINSDISRQLKVIEIVEEKGRAIIFYNFDYELDILHSLFDNTTYDVAEWNGHKHQDVPESDRWVYFVQYNSGAEAWNCIRTDTIIFYSQNYSYKIMVQASGRIDRLNTNYVNLYYYHLKSHAGLDLAIAKALKEKKKFNESKFVTDI